VVRHAPALVRKELGSPDVQVAVELERVAVDDLSAEAFGDAQSQLALPRACRPDHGHQGIQWRFRHRLPVYPEEAPVSRACLSGYTEKKRVSTLEGVLVPYAR
jgi:hypothetical protein